jgi:hypothetical protein
VRADAVFPGGVRFFHRFGGVFGTGRRDLHVERLVSRIKARERRGAALAPFAADQNIAVRDEARIEGSHMSLFLVPAMRCVGTRNAFHHDKKTLVLRH